MHYFLFLHPTSMYVFFTNIPWITFYLYVCVRVGKLCCLWFGLVHHFAIILTWLFFTWSRSSWNWMEYHISLLIFLVCFYGGESPKCTRHFWHAAFLCVSGLLAYSLLKKSIYYNVLKKRMFLPTSKPITCADCQINYACGFFRHRIIMKTFLHWSSSIITSLKSALGKLKIIV